MRSSCSPRSRASALAIPLESGAMAAVAAVLVLLASGTPQGIYTDAAAPVMYTRVRCNPPPPPKRPGVFHRIREEAPETLFLRRTPICLQKNLENPDNFFQGGGGAMKIRSCAPTTHLPRNSVF